MKARFYSAKEKAMILKLAKIGAETQLRQVGIRHDAMFAIAMYNAGLSVKTINKVIKERENVLNGVISLMDDKLGDYKLNQDLKRLGINIEIDFDEI